MWDGIDGGTSVELNDDARYRYLNLQFQDDVIIVASSIGHTENVGILRGLIQSKLKLGKWAVKLAQDPTRIREAYIASTQTMGANHYVYSLGPVSG